MDRSPTDNKLQGSTGATPTSGEEYPPTPNKRPRDLEAPHDLLPYSIRFPSRLKLPPTTVESPDYLDDVLGDSPAMRAFFMQVALDNDIELPGQDATIDAGRRIYYSDNPDQTMVLIRRANARKK